MKFNSENLKILREELGINKAEAARKLNLTPMAYGRYEKGEREPSYQTVCYIAQVFNTNVDYLYGLNSDMSSESIIINKADDPELYEVLKKIKGNKKSKAALLAYLEFFIDN